MVVCDPLAPHEEKSFSIPTGVYPVVLTLFKGHVACAKISFQDEKPTSWVKATTGSSKRKTYTVGVDSGTACFADAAFWSGLASDPTLVEREREARDWGPGQSFYIGTSADTANLIGFSTGMGDGNYAVWYGLNESEQPICMAIDFDILYEEDNRVCILPMPLCGEVVLPDFKDVDLRFEVIDKWKSRPYDHTKMLAFKYSLSPSAMLHQLEFQMVDAQGQLLATTKSEIDPRDLERKGRLVLLEATSLFPKGCCLKILMKSGVKALIL